MAAYPARVPVRPNQCFSALVDWRNEKATTFTESEEYRESWKATRCSNSDPLSPAMWPAVPHTKNSLKEHVRNAVFPAVRKNLWVIMSGITDDDSVLFAKAFGEPTDGKIIFGHSHHTLSCSTPCALNCSLTHRLSS